MTQILLAHRSAGRDFLLPQFLGLYRIALYVVDGLSSILASLHAQLMSLSWIRCRYQQLQLKHNCPLFYDRASRFNEREPFILECQQQSVWNISINPVELRRFYVSHC